MKHLKKVTIIITIFLAVSGISFTTYAESQNANDAAGVVEATVTIGQAAAAALEVIPGTLAKIEFSDDDDIAVWEIEVVDNQNITHDIEIDVNAGVITKNEVDRNDGEESEKADNYQTIIKIVKPLRMKHHPANHIF